MSVYSNRDFVSLSFFSHTRGQADTLALTFAWTLLFNWETVEEDEPDRHEKGEELVLRFSSSVHLQGGGVWLYLGWGRGVETERGGAFVSVSLTCLIVRLSSRLQTDAGAESWIRESHQRGGIRNECRQLRCKLGGKKISEHVMRWRKWLQKRIDLERCWKASKV